MGYNRYIGFDAEIPAGRKKNRRVFMIPGSYTWVVPSNTTEVEVHCWGGGGNGATAPIPATGYSLSGGGGGGYVTHVYPVTSGDSLSITVGNVASTSSVTVPTQSPTRPISATGGSPGTSDVVPGGSSPSTALGGSGGTGAFTIPAGETTGRTFAYSGGAGGGGTFPANFFGRGGGGASGFIYGDGGDGSVNPNSSPPSLGLGLGGFIARMNKSLVGGVSGQIRVNPAAPGAVPAAPGGTSWVGGFSENSNENWFYLEEITAIPSSSGYSATTGGTATDYPSDSGMFAGGPSASPPISGSGNRGGIAGGGGGASPTGAGGSGGTGIVIIYW